MKDPNKPKAPMTGYFRFVNSIRAQVTEETGLKGTAASKIFGERWAKLPQDQKDALKAEYTAEYAEYKQKLEEYKKTDEYAAFQKKKYTRKFKKAPKDKNAPKKPLSAYFIFLAEKRESLKAEFPEMSITQLGKKSGEIWKTLSEEEKEVYKAKHTALKEAYKTTRAEYEQTEEFKAYQALKAGWANDKKKAKKEGKKHDKKDALLDMQNAQQGSAGRGAAGFHKGLPAPVGPITIFLNDCVLQYVGPEGKEDQLNPTALTAFMQEESKKGHSLTKSRTSVRAI